MAQIIEMPKLSDTMTQGVVSKWLKKVGDSIKAGDILAEIESDKATMELESFDDGTLLHIGIEEGESAPVNAILAIIGKANEDISTLLDQKLPLGEEPTMQQPQTPDPTTEAVAPSVQEPAKQEPAKVEVELMEQPQQPATDSRLKASPLAKRLADDKGIDIGTVNGSGDGGRIVKRDVLEASNNTPQTQTPTLPAAFNTSPTIGLFEDTPVSQMRKTIAKRLAESKFSAPHFYLTLEINMDNAIEARKRINELSPTKVSFNDLVVKACAVALKQHPKINASWLGEIIRINHSINIGVAMALPEGLLVPVVRHADQKQLSAIASEVKIFAAKAKDKKLQPADWEGNTFTISNLGMMGIEEFTAIINPPDACILAVGAIVEKPIVRGGSVVVGNQMKVTLSCDHRIVDGAMGAEFLATLKSVLEEPLRMLV